MSPVFENAQAFYALELISSQEAGILPFEDALTAIEATLIFDKKMARGVEQGQEVVSRIRAGEALPNAAAEAGLEVRQAGPFARTEFVPGMGRQNAAVGAAFGLDVGEVTDVVTTPANAFIIELLAREPADSTVWRGQLPQQRQAVQQQLQQQRLQEWIQALRAAADIVDRRAQVLQPVDEDAQVPQMPMVF